ncbi:huntingtin-like [Uloborus diversus]|uniref:huntingtin-like n=1 Tax=Uloborus diversus TaxID=327109 RepID=UPI00240934A8|nr:huntingtin-like [Uloborus diversus]
MATKDKLMKSLEALKASQTASSSEDAILHFRKKETAASAKEKIACCTTIADAICYPNLRPTADFPKLLGRAMDTFMLCCDDENSDVRLMADECLNRTIKTLLDSHFGRLLVELFKEIKKDGPARSLRAALSRFGDICHLMRPQKCRPYTVNLVPALAKICQRKEEESVQETLAIVMTKVMPVLGQFTSDKEIKMLLKAFLPNLTVSSAIVRRSAATSLTCICQYSRRPSSFYSWMLSALFELILPAQDERPVCVILGVLLCLRHLVPHFSAAMCSNSFKGNVNLIQSEEDRGVTKEQILKVYEITLHFAQHPDHNVTTATLETLYQLLKNAPKVLQSVLVSSSGITKSLIYVSDMPKLSRAMSESQSSVMQSSLSVDESALEDDHDIYIPENKVAAPLSGDEDAKSNCDSNIDRSLSLDGDFEDLPDHSRLKFKQMYDETLLISKPSGANLYGTPKRIPCLKKGASDENMVDTDDEFWDRNSPAPSPGPLSKIEFKIGNIGSFTDVDVPLKYCCRLLCSSFLLVGTHGSLMPDKNARVSVKSLALGCLSNIFLLYPSAFFWTVKQVQEEAENTDAQRIWDVTLYAMHADPHIRGQAAVMIGNLLANALKECGGWWSKWISDYKKIGAPDFPTLLTRLTSVVQDDSSVASKLGLVGLKQCLTLIFNSKDAVESFHILETLLNVKDNSYWLSKVELAEVLSRIPFKVVNFLESKRTVGKSILRNISYQDKVLSDVLIPLLGDEDFRVRQASASALVELIPKLYFPVDHLNMDPINAIAEEHTDLYLDMIHKRTLQTTLPLVHASVKPFSTENTFAFDRIVDASLSRIINLLVTTLRMCTNRYLVYGCCHALSLLSEKFLVTVFSHTWNAVFSDVTNEYAFTEVFRQHTQVPASKPIEISLNEKPSQTSDLLCHLILLVDNTSLCLDLVAHTHVLQLVGNLLSGVWYKLFFETHKNSNNSQELKPDGYVFPLIEKVFLHLMRLLNIFTHVVEEQYPISIANRPALPSLPNAPSLSPIKRKNKMKEETLPSGINSIKGSPSKVIDKTDSEKERSGNKIPDAFGQFHTFPLYMKLFEILQGAYGSYKISMDFQSSEKFCQLLKCGLDVMSQILEMSESHDMVKNSEEILCYLKSLMVMEPCSSVQCVRQLLKCLFGTNVVSVCQDADFTLGMNRKFSSSGRIASTVPGLYHTVVSYPYGDFTHSLADKTIKSVPSNEIDLVSFRCLNFVKHGRNKLPGLLKSGSKGDKTSLAAHVRLFEGVVIRALQQYTLASDVALQCQVLDLLAQLVQLRVNYCLLDADQIFIGYVIKQFDYIDEGQIRNADILIPKIFYFLILLSYERYHSKPVISVPKVLQLCDGLIASGQPPEKYVVRALQPVVEDLFLVRTMNKMDQGKELDAQREVIVSTLFKLVYYPQVLDLFCMVVRHSRLEGEDKWRKTSRQIVDVVLPLLSRQQIQIENQAQLNMLYKLLESVASNVFRPVDILLKALFSQPKDLNVSPNIQRWMCMVLTILRVLIDQANEEAVLSRLSDMGISIKIHRLGLSPSFRCEKEHSGNDIVDNAELSPGTAFARFLFQVVGVTVESLHNQVYTSSAKDFDDPFLCQETSQLLLYLTYMFQSGTFRTVTTCAASIVKEESSEQKKVSKYIYYSISDIENIFLKLTPFYPTVVIQWCNILTLLNSDNRSFWSKIVQPYEEMKEGEPAPISMQSTHHERSFLPSNLEMVRRGGVILLCDYVCENPTDVVQMTWLIVHHVCDIIDLCSETTVRDFISAIHRNPAASGLWIQAIINARHEDLSKPSFWKRAVSCLRNIHLSQSGKLLNLLVERFFATHHLLIATACNKLACKRLEILLYDPTVSQLSVQDIDNMINAVKSSGISKRHADFILLCEKLRSLHSDEPSPSSDHPLLQSSMHTEETQLNKDWYLKFVKEECFNLHFPPKQCAHLLSQLKYEDTVAIMACTEFHLSLLEQCLSLGAHLILSSEKYALSRSDDLFVGVTESSGSALYRAAQYTLLQRLADFVTLLPRTARYQQRLHKIFLEDSFWNLLSYLVPATYCYLKTLDLVPGKHISNEALEDIALLSIISCEAVIYSVQSGKRLSLDLMKLALLVLDKTLKNREIASVYSFESHFSWLCSTINVIHRLAACLEQVGSKSYLVTPFGCGDNLTSEQTQARNACIEIAQLIEWLENYKGSPLHVPEQLFSPFKSVIRGLARLPVVNSFARTPPILWQLGWSPEFSGDHKTAVPPPPGEYLQDRDVLKQYIYRINLLGWISRQQFEETWMALLGVLSATPVDNKSSREEDEERIRTSCLAVKSITSLLLQTLLLPQPGNPQNSYFLIQPRDKPLAFQHTKCGKKLMSVRIPIHTAIQKVLHCDRIEEQILNVNAERVAAPYPYSLSQVSLEYLNAAIGLVEESEELEDGSASSNSSPLSAIGGIVSFQQREQCLSNLGLDIHSCLHFLLDLYSQWLSPETRPPLTLLTEVVKSIVALSDIFMEKIQFEWMLDTFLEVQKIHPIEDEIIMQYLIFGICKGAAVLGIEPDVLDKLKKLLELCLKSTYLPTKISTLHGLLYVLEHGGGDETSPLLPIATEYILTNLDAFDGTKLCSQNEDHILIMWAVAFYIIENYLEEISEEEFSQKIYQLSLAVCSNSDESSSVMVYMTVLHGLERLLVAEILSGKEANLLLKFTADRIRTGDPVLSLAALGLFLSCMYIGKSTNIWSNELVPDTAKGQEKSHIQSGGREMYSEFMLVAMERVTTLFDRIRRGYPFEAEVICEILPAFLMEFFPVQEILNKIITEFLSSQQPHPQFMAKVIFEVFQYLHKQSQEEIIHEWVLLSLSNFMQRSPLCMAIWSLNCFFISATKNYWFKALFPYVQNRMGKMEEQDKILFCTAGVNFRNQLQNDEQKQAYYNMVQTVAKPGTPYADLLRCLQT